MKVVFFDNNRETFRPVYGVEQMSCGKIKHQGRYVNMWILELKEGGTMTLKMKDFELCRVEME